MKVLVVPDSFKGSVSSLRFCEIAERALMKVDKRAILEKIPMADGGEGSVDAMVLNTEGTYVSIQVSSPLGKPIVAKYGVLGDGKTAVMEMSAASGITLVAMDELNPLEASTLGTGQMILDAVRQGCTRVIMGIGGSATNDCGMGMLKALGYKFYDEAGRQLRGCGKDLGKVASIDDSQLKLDARLLSCLVACDVNNPLYGKDGATYTYGSQKGGSPKQLKSLEEGVISFNKVVTKKLGKDFSGVAGAGAAGGLGFGLVAFLQGKLQNGFSLISQEVGLEEKIASGQFDLIITGEGRMDRQTAFGKLPSGVAGLGKKYGVPVIAVVGSVAGDVEKLYEQGIVAVFSAIRSCGSLEEILASSEEDLLFVLENVFRSVLAFKK